MKTITRMLAILTAVAFTAPAFAQADTHARDQKASKQISAAIERGVKRAVKRAVTPKYDPALLTQAEVLLQQDRDAHRGYAQHDLAYYYKLLKNKAQDPSWPKCTRCGQAIEGNGQHCPAAHYTGLCTSHQVQPAKQQDETFPSHCPKCGHAYTTDERYHGATHECKVEEETKYCIYCGEAIVENNQKCSAVQGADCTVNCPDCGKNLRDEKNLINGEHRCKFKSRLTPVPAKKVQK